MRERTPVPAKLIEALPKLRLIMSTVARICRSTSRRQKKQYHGVRYERTAAPDCGIDFCADARACAPGRRESDDMKNGKLWQDSVGIDLCGKTLGIIGLGRLGSKVAGIGKAFGMRVAAWSPNLTPDKCAEADVRYATKEQIFKGADIVSMHMQLSASTQYIIDAAELARMKRSALLINTSRGPLINETALLDALRKGVIAGFGVDVYDQEPLPADHPFRGLANVVMTPHIGFVTADNYRTYYGGAVEGIRAWLDGKPIRWRSP